MSGMWNRTLIYLGLREESDELHDEMPARFDPQDDPHAEHAPQRPRPAAGGIPPDEPTEAIERAPALAGSAVDDGYGYSDRGAGLSASSERRGRSGSARRSVESVRRDERLDGGRDERGHDRRDDRREVHDERPVRSAEPSNVRSLYSGDDVNLRSSVAPLTRTAVVELETFEDVESVGARYRTGQPVLFDVSGTDKATARRAVDFVSGLTFALRGSLSKVGTGAFLLVPDGVELSADERRRLGDLGYRVSLASHG